MPQVPVSGGPSVAPGGIPNLRAPQEAFGGGQAARPVDTSGVERVVNDIREHEIQKANQIAVSDAGSQLSALETNLLYDPDHGALTKRGVDAFAMPDQVADAWRTHTADIEEGLTNDTQKLAFRNLVASHGAALNVQVQSHLAQQRQAYDNETTDNHVAHELNAATLGYQDAQRGEMAVGTTRAVLTDYWKRNGHSSGDGVDEFAQDHIAQRISAVRAAVLKQFGTAGDSQAASAYFDAHKQEFVGKDLIAAQKLVDAAKGQHDGDAAARRILGIGQPDPLPGDPPPVVARTMTAALALADKIADDDTRKEATQLIVSHFTHQEQAARYDREAARARMVQKVEASGGRINRADPDWQTIAGFPEGEHVEHRSDQLLKPPKDPGDPDAFLTHLNMASVSPASRTEFLHADFTGKDGEGMNTSQRTRLIQLQTQYRATDTRVQTAADHHDLVTAQADAKHYQRLAETAASKGDTDAQASALARQHTAEERIKQLTHNPLGDAGTIPFHDFASEPASFDPTQGTLHPVAPAQATPHMIEGASRNPAYAQYLRSMGVLLPKTLPAPVVPKR